MERLPAFSETNVCRNQEEFMESDPLRRFLRSYNSMMHRRDSTWETVTVDMLQNDYDLARKVADDALEMKLPGGISLNVASRVKDLINDALDDIRSRNLDRVLSVAELCERIPGFEEAMRKSKETYLRFGYDEALRRAGVLAPEEEYEVPVPVITEKDLQIMLAEEDPGSGFYKKMMIDDGRLSDADTLAHFYYGGQALPKRLQHIEDSRALDGDDLEILHGELDETSTVAEIKREFARVVEEKNLVAKTGRLMFYSEARWWTMNLMSEAVDRDYNDTYEISLEKYSLPIGLGQLLRLEAFLEDHDSEAYKLLFALNDHTREVGNTPVSLMLNNISREGNALCISRSEKQKGKPRFSQVNPGKHEVWSITKEVILFG